MYFVNKNENSKNILIVDLWFKKNIFSPFKNSLKKNHSMVLQIAIIAKKKFVDSLCVLEKYINKKDLIYLQYVT